MVRMPESALRLDRVTLAFRVTETTLIEDFSLSISPGQIVTIMGPSGSGKSTLLAYAGGFLDRTAFRATGTVSLGDNRLDDKPAAARRLGILFQDPVLFPHLSVGGNLLFGLSRDRHQSGRDQRAVVDEALASAGLAGFGSRDPATLSGGQKARVALLRTLLAAPSALLLDEPFGKLDAALRAYIRSLVFAQARERRLPTLLVTHDPADAAAADGLAFAIDGATLRPLPAAELSP